MSPTTRPTALDLFCGAGGTSMGLYMAGFDPVGLDSARAPLKKYPFPHICADILDTDLVQLAKRTKAVFIIAGPPCQGHSPMQSGRGREAKYKSEAHPPQDLIAYTRARLRETGLPYIIENVQGAGPHMINPVTLCGSASNFRLRIRRHRLFESSTNLQLKGAPCDHAWQLGHRPYQLTDGSTSGIISAYGTSSKGATLRATARPLDVSQTDLVRIAMGIDWMSARELSQAIPPAFTNFLGLQVLAQLAAPGRNGRRRRGESHLRVVA